MIRRHSQGIVPPKRKPTALALALQEAFDKAKAPARPDRDC